MEYLSIFLISLVTATLTIRCKRFWLGDFIEIRWNNQPVLFILVAGLLYLCAIDGLFNGLSMFSSTVFSDDFLKKLNTIVSFSFCFVFLIVFIMVKKITIKKKNYTWEENSLIRSIFVVVPFFLSVFFLREYLLYFN